MKKTILGVFTAMAIINNVSAAEQKLPDPNREGGMPLMQALNERHSVKQFGDKAIDDQTLSDLLWAAYGVNRSGGLRTIPTAMNQKDLEIYVAKADGIWQYNAISHTLKQIGTDNILPLFQTQDYMKNVPLVLIYTGSKDEDYRPCMRDRPIRTSAFTPRPEGSAPSSAAILTKKRLPKR